MKFLQVVSCHYLRAQISHLAAISCLLAAQNGRRVARVIVKENEICDKYKLIIM